MPFRPVSRVHWAALAVAAGLYVCWRRSARRHAPQALVRPLPPSQLIEWPGSREEAAARALLRRQPGMREELDAFLSSYPLSGLYDDEADAGPSAFHYFLQHVRAVLESSPRSEMLRRLDEELSILIDNSPVAASLVGALRLPRSATLMQVHNAMVHVHPGRLYHQWKSAVESSQKKPAFVDDTGVQDRVRRGYKKKAALLGHGPPSADEFEAVLDKAKVKEMEQRRAAAHRAAEIWPRVEADEQYQRYVQLQGMWRDSGIEDLWRSFEEVDTEDGKSRQRRGLCFELDQAQICVGLIALRLGLLQGSMTSRAAAGLRSTLGISSSVSRRVAAARAVFWTDKYGKQLGEADLALFEVSPRETHQMVGTHKCEVAGQLLALCEMKAGCFEVSAALEQHERHLRAARDRCADAPFLRLGSGRGAPLLVISHLYATPIFVATLIPRHRFAIGAEARLVQAMGQVARRNARAARVTRNIVHASVAANGPIGGHVHSASGGNDESVSEEDCVEDIAVRIRQLMGTHRLMQSPLGLLRSNRGAECVLVLGKSESLDTAARRSLLRYLGPRPQSSKQE